MKHSVGLDVSVKETAICIVDEAGKVVREGKVATEPQAIIALDFPPWSGGVRSERHAAARMVIPSMLARASAGVR